MKTVLCFNLSLPQLGLLLPVLLLGSACKGEAAREEHDAHEQVEHEGEHDAHEAGEHDDAQEREANVLTLSKEAIERAGIVIGAVEKRALSGGVGIPAEVQFEPTSTAHVGPLVPGRITRVSVSLGDAVKAGQLLGVVASSDVSAARARLAQAEAQLSAAESTVERQKQLTAEGIGAQRALIDAEARASELRAEVQGQKSQLSLYGSGSGGELTLKAPIDGIIVSLHGTLGETATPEEPVFIVTDPTRVWVRGNVPELEISRVQSGGAAQVRLHAFPDLLLGGTVAYVAPAIDEASRSLPIRVKLELPDARLRSGLFGSIELLGGTSDQRTLVLPVDALATLDGQNMIFTADAAGTTFKATPVSLGRRAGGFVEVLSGVKEGDSFAKTGAFTLKSALRSSEISSDHDH